MNTDDVYIEHGFARIGRMGFATGSQNSVGIRGIRVREEENDVIYLETNLTLIIHKSSASSRSQRGEGFSINVLLPISPSIESPFRRRFPVQL